MRHIPRQLVSDVSAPPAANPANPTAKLAPCPVRLRLLADRLASEGDAEIADHVRRVAGEVDDEARRGAARPDGLLHSAQ